MHKELFKNTTIELCLLDEFKMKMHIITDCIGTGILNRMTNEEV